MQNYSVEDNLDIDFFSELKKLQQAQAAVQEPEQMHDTDANVCLITDQPLNVFHVALACGHKFNYEPLYQEVLRQKGRLGVYNYYEKIGTNQIKCPYCRSMTNQLLPYIGNNPHPVISRLVGVNAPANICMPGIPCSANKCTVNAFYEFNEKQYCYRHHVAAMKYKSIPSPANADAETMPNIQRCIAENQTGKNKGKQCRLKASEGTTMCKIHAKCITS